MGSKLGRQGRKSWAVALWLSQNSSIPWQSTCLAVKKVLHSGYIHTVNCSEQAKHLNDHWCVQLLYTLPADTVCRKVSHTGRDNLEFWFSSSKFISLSCLEKLAGFFAVVNHTSSSLISDEAKTFYPFGNLILLCLGSFQWCGNCWVKYRTRETDKCITLLHRNAYNELLPLTSVQLEVLQSFIVHVFF